MGGRTRIRVRVKVGRRIITRDYIRQSESSACSHGHSAVVSLSAHVAHPQTRLGTEIFQVAEDVKGYIVKQLRGLSQEP